VKQPKVALEGASIVVRGLFNAAIFSPSWFREQGLIGEEAFAEAEIEVISRDDSNIRMKWLNCSVNRDGLELSTGEPEEFDRLRDVAAGVLRHLPHTPIAALGMNRHFHFVVETIDRWHAIGDALAPKGPWEDELLHPGMRSVVLWGVRDNDLGGRIQVGVEPSLRVKQGVYVAVNDHYTLDRHPPPQERRVSFDTEGDSVEPTSKKVEVAMEVLADRWSESLAHAERLLGVVSGIAAEGA